MRYRSFEEFLHKEGGVSLDVFMEEVRVGGSFSSNRLLSEFNNPEYYPESRIIDYGFTWNDTKQGHNFWKSLHERWVICTDNANRLSFRSKIDTKLKESLTKSSAFTPDNI